MVLLCFFFFKQKTAYEMRISDWSSDVCSSDLADGEARLRGRRRVEGGGRSGRENRRFGRYREGRSGRGKGRREAGHREEGGQERLRRVRQAARPDYMSVAGRHDSYPPPAVYGTFTRQDRKSDVCGNSVSVRVDLGGRGLRQNKTIIQSLNN